MRIRVPIVVVLLFALLTGCASNDFGAPVSGRIHNPNASYHTVARDETLFSISWMYGHDYRDVARWNSISSPYYIHTGQRLRLKPQTGSRSQQRPTYQKQQQKKQASIKAKSTYRYSKPGRWVWPTRGKLVQGFTAKEMGKKGIAISGRTGQSIVASAAGKVVYSGSGLLRYGKLIIIKHNNTYLSAYAHNRKLLVKEGASVTAGQAIAEMGNTGTKRTMLHFEIRKDGKPVNPLQYLPKKK
jgi:lipoprotein NlpD